MISRRKVLGFLGALAVSLSAASAFAADAIRIGVEAAYPPFSMKTSDGTLTGFDIDIATALCKQMKRECTFVEQDWDGMIPALNARKFDAIIASMAITEERMKKVDFTNKYYYSAASLLAPKDTTVTATAEGTSGRSIGIQRGTAHECYHAAHFPKAELKQYQTSEEIYLDLTSGRLDAALVDTLPALDWLKANDKESKYKLIADDLYDVKCFGEGIGIAIRKGDNELREVFSQAIKDIRGNGAYKEVNDKYFTVDIYGQ